MVVLALAWTGYLLMRRQIWESTASAERAQTPPGVRGNATQARFNANGTSRPTTDRTLTRVYCRLFGTVSCSLEWNVDGVELQVIPLDHDLREPVFEGPASRSPSIMARKRGSNVFEWDCGAALPGRYRIRALGLGATWDVRIDVDHHGPIELTIPNPSRIAIRAFDAVTKAPLTHVSGGWRVWRPTDDVAGFETGSVVSYDAFTHGLGNPFDFLAPLGMIEVVVDAPGYASTESVFTATSRTTVVDVLLRKAMAIEIELRKQGVPLTDALGQLGVSVRGVDHFEECKSFAWSSQFVTCDVSRPGDYLVLVRAIGNPVPLATRTVSVGSNGTTKVVIDLE